MSPAPTAVLVHASVQLLVLGELRRRLRMVQECFALALGGAYPRHLSISIANFRLDAAMNAAVDGYLSGERTDSEMPLVSDF